jgi:polyisoprenoid-binding protein YceI
VFVWSNIALAKAEKWDIDTAHSNIYFEVKHIYSTVRGLFHDFSGTLILDPEKPDTGSAEFEVKVSSIDTGITKRDNHLRSNDFFAVKKFPVMTFKSSRVEHVEGDQYILTGNLTIKGVTQKIDLPFTYFKAMKSPVKKGQVVAGFEADFNINRLDYKVGTGKFADMGVVGTDVRIVISIEALSDK